MSADIRTHRAFKEFFEEFYPAVYAFLINYTGDGELSRDLAQDTFLKVYEKREEIGEVEYARAYLYTAARRLYWDHCKHLQVEKHYKASYEKESPDDDYSFLKSVTHQETLRVLYAAIGRLPCQAQNIIMLHLQGKSNEEAAAELNISVNTVKTLKKSAYTTLRSSLSKEYALLLLLFFP